MKSKHKGKAGEFIELNLDGLVGPTHSFAGLAFGNQASLLHANQVSYPRAAALQGLNKMRLLHQLGLAQGILPPPIRPNLSMLHRLGFQGSPEHMLTQAFKLAPHLLNACYSASSMWAANAATVSSEYETADKKLHLTPANLISQLHRSQEAAFTSKVLQAIFHDTNYFVHHPHLPPTAALSDEGAANTNRLCQHHGATGINVFVYGQSAFAPNQTRPQRYPARQTREACEANARIHGLNLQRTFFFQQHPEAIDAGVFHNDVISLANESVFLVHEEAFVDQQRQLDEIKKAADFQLTIIQVPHQRISLKEAVNTYLFNSQLLTLPDQSMSLIAPEECRESANATAFIDKLLADSDNPIQQVHYIDLKQSMNNGGGPACLRLRIPISNEALHSIHQGILLTDDLFEKLTQWINKHYREHLVFSDLLDPHLLIETQTALAELEKLLHLKGLYNFY